MIKSTLLISFSLLQFCTRQKEKIQPLENSLKTITINVVDTDGNKYSEQDKYPITVENSSGSFKTVSTGLYFRGLVPNGLLRTTIPNSNWFYGTHEDFEVKNDTTIVLMISAGYRWRKAN